MTTICALSDLHGYLPETVPEADILVVAGDISLLSIDRDIDKAMDWFESDFVGWMRSTPHKYRLFIGGNHDFCIEANLKYFQEYIDPEDMKFLHDSGLELEGIKFYGVPWVPNLKNWAFCAEPDVLNDKYEAVPEDTNVVISHGPPFGCADVCGVKMTRSGHIVPEHVGSKEANRMMARVQPDHYICGHIHEGYGHYWWFEREVWNVATMDVGYDPVNAPVIIEL